jgi:hypothetical protein
MRKFIARTEDHTINGINLVLAGILFFSPWLFGFSGETTAAWTALITGGVIAIVAAVALAELRQWEEWVNGILGLFVAVSPWLLGFSGVSHAMWTHVVLGLVIAALAAYEAWQLSDETRASVV